MTENPKEIIIMHLEVVVMPNGEIINQGKTIGWVKTHGQYLHSLRPITEKSVPA